MSFAVEWEDEAEQDLAALPPLLASQVLDRLDEMTKDPVRRSRPTHFPYRPAQCFEFPVHFEGVTYHFSVLFHYRPDEQGIILEAIGCMPRPPNA